MPVYMLRSGKVWNTWNAQGREQPTVPGNLAAWLRSGQDQNMSSPQQGTAVRACCMGQLQEGCFGSGMDVHARRLQWVSIEI